MKNLILLLVLICSSAFAVQVPVPEFAKYINDLTGTLTREEVSTLTSQIKTLTQKSHAQLIVLVVETTGDETIEQYATRVFERWQPGHKNLDDGILLVVAWQDHTVHIEIGYGLEGILTDAQSGKLYATVLFLRLKRAILLSACNKVLVILKPDYQKMI